MKEHPIFRICDETETYSHRCSYCKGDFEIFERHAVGECQRPLRLLDCFSGAGGAAMGYYRAGFTEIVGVDIVPQPRYPFAFVQGDALEFLATVKPGDFDAIHCSPPCQGYSRMRHLPWLKNKVYPMLIGPVRAELERIGGLWVIENVEGAPLTGITLCGVQFGAKMYRHRVFEASVTLEPIPHEPHRKTIGAGRDLRNRTGDSQDGWVTVGGNGGNAARWVAARAAMGISWMTRDELSQSIPPAFTEYVGKQLLAQVLDASRAAERSPASVGQARE